MPITKQQQSLLLIAIIMVAIFGFMVGYILRDRGSGTIVTNKESNKKEVADTENNSSSPETPSETVIEEDGMAVEAVYSVTGEVKNIEQSSITVRVERQESIADVTAQLTDETQYADLFVKKHQGIPTTNEQSLQREDIVVGNVVTVYTKEDINTAEQLTATKIQRLNNTF